MTNKEAQRNRAQPTQETIRKNLLLEVKLLQEILHHQLKAKLCSNSRAASDQKVQNSPEELNYLHIEHKDNY